MKTLKHIELDELVCGHVLRTVYGLPCSHELLILEGQGWNMEQVHVNDFWQKMNDDNSCETMIDNDLRSTFNSIYEYWESCVLQIEGYCEKIVGN